MAELKSLAKDTAIYGLSSIIGRFLNYLLVPIYAMAMSASSGGYGIVTEVYAWTALLMVILTYGMETTFFRFVNKEAENPAIVYSTVLKMVGTTSLFFAIICILLLRPIASVMGYADHPWYIGMMVFVVAQDAFQCIPFAYLRYKRQALKFALLKLLFIILNIALNLTYYVFMKGNDVFYAFLFNLICTSFIGLLLIPTLKFRGGFNRHLAKRMLNYSYPILILGIAGILNQVADKIIFRHVYPDAESAKSQLAIYGACSKIAMIMAMLTQAFRYAYEPFVFGKSKDKDSKETYAQGMKYFIIFTLLAFLAVMFYLDILKYILQPDYWEGLKVVPIVMAAEIFMGVYFNLSFWYKLIDQTKWGAYFSFAGCFVLIAINVIFVPIYGYIACAWAGFTGYAVAMLLSYFIGQKKFPINYDLKNIGTYVLLAIILYLIAMNLPFENSILVLTVRTVLLFVFVAYIIKKDLPLKAIPFINRFVK
ncbi:lipopolysaccharide biosynthesis protein [Phocaeicola oris]|uniref:lipopolysaccharide biosynthesis protein n=1 Tax=Phocaeicola oris TaxID=2896850 RepID=UPI00234F74AD|nr:oligosaccharide flippase family protein [Phocaeicola oris]MCE2616872.1 oligosaccharide flippase family protein [Phocaeicola oris]